MNKNKNFEDFLPDKNSIYLNYLKKSENSSSTSIKKKEVIECIKTVMDPEIPVNLYDLGLIYSIDINNNNVIIEMSLTNPNCPVAGQMPKNVGKSVESLEGLNYIEVRLVWDPKWRKEFMSEDAKLALDIF